MKFDLDVDYMEGAIGGSSLDDLRHLMELDGLDDGDIVFAIVDDPTIDLGDDYTEDDCYPIKVGQTYLAKCMAKSCPLFKAIPSCLEDEICIEWKEI